MSDWNPELYLQFERERTQPVRDLVSRIELPNPARIIDLGCGPGNSTVVLKNRWPDASIVGLDRSPAMIAEARRACPDVEWVEGDAGADLSHLGLFDLVFANASLQWLPDHRRLLPRLFSLIRIGGALAVQIPKFADMPVAQALQEVARRPEYTSLFAGFDSGVQSLDESLYYDVLCGASRAIDLWVTLYYHVLKNHPAIIEWVKSTGMRPYLDRLPEDQRAAFTAQVLARIRKQYPAQCDDRVLSIFKRLFFVAYKT